MPNAKDRNIDFSKSFVIIPVHNRRETTLKCLSQLKSQGDLEAFQVVVVDDGSTDGTGEVIQKDYPQVHLITGDGNLWWTGAIEMGMHYAYSQGATYIVWLNDDTLPLPGTLKRLVGYCKSYPQTLVSAQCYETIALQHPTYGGHHRKKLRHLHCHATPGTVVDCISLSGNLVCLPRSVIEHIGWPPSQHAPHYFGDVLYTWRAKQAGFQLKILGDATAICRMNLDDTSWLLGTQSVSQRLQGLTRPKSLLYPSGYWQFCCTIWPMIGWVIFLGTYLRLATLLLLRLVLPMPLLRQLKSQLGT